MTREKLMELYYSTTIIKAAAKLGISPAWFMQLIKDNAIPKKGHYRKIRIEGGQSDGLDKTKE